MYGSLKFECSQLRSKICLGRERVSLKMFRPKKLFFRPRGLTARVFKGFILSNSNDVAAFKRINRHKTAQRNVIGIAF